MKILILHQHFRTPQRGGAIRSFYLAKTLVDHGHRVAVVTSSGDNTRMTSNTEGIEVHYLPIPYHNRFGFYARGLSFIRFIIASSRMASKFSDFDCCYAISVPLTVGVSALWIKYRYRIPYFFEVGDLWPEAPIQLGFVKNGLLKRSLCALEKKIYRNADAIVALSEAIQAGIEKKVPRKKIYVIPNMADCDFYWPEQKSAALETRFNVGGKFVVAYIGALGIANGLDYFLACADAFCQSNLPIHFIICGEGAMGEPLMAAAARCNLANVSFAGFVNRDGVKEVMNITDAVFVCYKSVPILETGSPNKFFDGLAAGKLIVVNFGGWIRREVEENRCGIFVDPRRSTDFVEKIRPFISDAKLLKSFQTSARELGERKYSRKLLSEAFAKLFN